MHDFLVEINEIVRKILPLMQETEDFLIRTVQVLEKVRAVVSVTAGVLVFFPVVGEFAIELALLIERLDVFIQQIAGRLQNLIDFVDKFDISNIIADSAVAKLT